MDQPKINILLCFDDNDWNYARHAAVTILSVLETNKNHKIKFYIMTSSITKNNVNEFKRIIDLYKQEIEFIISKDIVPEELKKVIINKREWIWWPRYRWFFSNFIKDIDRILYFDCDILVVWDILEIYNMNMHDKAIAACLDYWPFHCQDKYFHLKNYINSWVLLFDAKKYDVSKINVKKMKEINKKYSKYFHGRDQDKANIIFKNDIFVYNKSMNYQIISKYFNKGLSDTKIIHCLQKPYILYPNVPKSLVKKYYYYLNITKWKWFPKESIYHWNLKSLCGYIYFYIYFLCYNFLLYTTGELIIKRLTNMIWVLKNNRIFSAK